MTQSKVVKPKLPKYIATSKKQGGCLQMSYDRQEVEDWLQEWVKGFADPRDAEDIEIAEVLVPFPAPKLGHWHRVVEFWDLDLNEQRSLIVFLVEKLEAIAMAEREGQGTFEEEKNLFEGFLGRWGAGTVKTVKCGRDELRSLPPSYKDIHQWIDMASVPIELQAIIIKAADSTSQEIYGEAFNLITAKNAGGIGTC